MKISILLSLTLLLLTTSCAIEKKNIANDDVRKIGVVSLVGNSVDSIDVNRERFGFGNNTIYTSDVPGLEVDQQIENRIIDQVATRSSYKIEHINADRSLAQETDITAHINKLTEIGKANNVDLVIGVFRAVGKDGEPSGTVIKQGSGAVTLESNFVVELVYPQAPKNYLKLDSNVGQDKTSHPNDRILPADSLLSNVRLKSAAEFTDGEKESLKTEIGANLDQIIPPMLKQAGLLKD